jgi:hypothetical protein
MLESFASTGVDMKLRVCFAAMAALLASGNLLAAGGIARISIIDRDSGTELVPHLYHGEYWVAGTPGAHYAIEIENRLSERLLAVASVDGVNVISGATAGWDQTGYVFDPGEQYRITGWRKSDAEIAAFTFTDSADSYAGRTGRPANIGIIGVALFRERPPERVYSPPDLKESTAEPEAAPMPDAAAARNAPSGGASRAEASAPAQSVLPAPKLGTGHGEREASYVHHTDFNRLQPQPNEVIRIHYDSLNNLIAMGIVKRPRRSPPNPNPFPASPEQQYAPDPPPG